MTRPTPTPPGSGPIAERRRLAARGRAALERLGAAVSDTRDLIWRERLIRGIEKLADEAEEINAALKEGAL